MKLDSDLERLGRSHTGVMAQDEMINKIRDRDAEIREMQNKYDDLESGFISKENMFKESKAYMQDLLKQVQEAKKRNIELELQNSRLERADQHSKDLKSELESLKRDNERTEKEVYDLSTDAFVKPSQGVDIRKVIRDLEEKCLEQDKFLNQLKKEEKGKTESVTQLKDDIKKLEGERDYVFEENKKLKGNVVEGDRMNDINVYKTLFKMDPERYGQAISDLNLRGDDVFPVWANLDFLERGKEQIDPNNAKALKDEILKLRHENKDFAAELEKAQHLLHLQKDIERDNVKYYDAEKRRLELVMKSAQTKSEELARRADEKQRQITEVQHKLGMRSRSPSPIKPGTGMPSPSRSELDKMETQSEFSVMTNESELRTDENFLDLVVESGEFYYDTFTEVLEERELVLFQKTLITFVTVDFFDHDTETSSIAEGYRPVYQCQFSFKNKVDEFFVSHIQR